MEGAKMSFRKIDPSFKFDIIQALWSGSNYNQLSKKHNIPRATIYLWERTAIDAITSAFEKKTPGKRTADLETENRNLKEQLRNMYHDKHRTAQSGVHDLKEAKPIICYNCSGSHIKKNGTVFTKQDGLRQRYTCQDCSLSIYLEVKKTPSLSD
jgi:transposase-like protein